MNLETIIKELKAQKCRITPQRKVFLDIMYNNQDILMTVEELTHSCQLFNSDINTTTVYRNLELLDSLGFVYSMNIDRQTTAYKLICHDQHHHHLICSNCGKMESIDFCPINSELLSLINEKGFTLGEHSLKLFGLCKNCSETIQS